MTPTAQQRQQAQRVYVRWQQHKAEQTPDDPTHGPEMMSFVVAYLIGFVFGALVVAAAWWLAGGV